MYYFISIKQIFLKGKRATLNGIKLAIECFKRDEIVF